MLWPPRWHDRSFPLRNRCSHLVPFALIAAVAAPFAVGAQSAKPIVETLPDTTAITPALIAKGRDVFRNHGGCYVCHGMQLEGGAGLALKKTKWKDATNGDLPALVRVVSNGVPGTLMVAHPNGIDEKRVVEVAAYIWAVNRGKAKP
ncbi:MAG: c-type cytochrome [Gemmatimonadaceae bacterium]